MTTLLSFISIIDNLVVIYFALKYFYYSTFFLTGLSLFNNSGVAPFRGRKLSTRPRHPISQEVLFAYIPIYVFEYFNEQLWFFEPGQYTVCLNHSDMNIFSTEISLDLHSLYQTSCVVKILKSNPKHSCKGTISPANFRKFITKKLNNYQLCN